MSRRKRRFHYSSDPTLDDLADKLLREWAVKMATSTGRDVGDVLRDDGILDAQRQVVINNREEPLSKYEEREYRDNA